MNKSEINQTNTIELERGRLQGGKNLQKIIFNILRDSREYIETEDSQKPKK